MLGCVPFEPYIDVKSRPIKRILKGQCKGDSNRSSVFWSNHTPSLLKYELAGVYKPAGSPKAPLHGPWSPADGVSFAANDLDISMAVLSTAGPVKRGPITSVLHPLKTLESGVINVRAFD